MGRLLSWWTGGQSDFAGLPLLHEWHGLDVRLLFQTLVLIAASALLFAGASLLMQRLRRWRWPAFVAVLLAATAAYAANTKLSSLSAGSAMADADLLYDVQSAGSGGVKVTLTNVWAWIQTHTLPIGSGGTGATTQQGALNAVAPTPTRAGDVIYYNGTNWVNLAGNNSGTNFLQENASGVPTWAAGGGGSGTVTSVTCPSGGTFTTSGTCAVDVKTYCASGCDGTSGATWTRPAGVTLIHIDGCGAGGGGGGGSQVISTGGSGGGGGGGADCHDVWLKAADAGSSQTITVPGGGAGGAALTSATTANNGINGVAGGTATFGSGVCGFCSWFGGGGGQGGRSAATNSTGGGGGSPWGVGTTAGVTGATGCTNGLLNGGIAGNSQTNLGTYTCGGGAAGSSTTGASSQNGGYAQYGAPAGEAGAGINGSGVAQGASGATGGGSRGCVTPPSGGAAGSNNGGSTAADFVYHPGCGGGGGGGQLGQTGVPGNGGAGTSGGGGGGGGTVCVGTSGTCSAGNTSGAGGNGGASFIVVESF